MIMTVEIAIIRVVGDYVGSYEDSKYEMDLIKSHITDWDRVDEDVLRKLSGSMAALKLHEKGYRIIVRERDPDFIPRTVKGYEAWLGEMEAARLAEKAKREKAKQEREQKKMLKLAKSEKQLLEELAKKHGMKIAPAK